MTIQIDSGTRLGPYEIVSPIGAGGMGEVWRARDTRLDRQVAIKVLPAALAQNEQFRARFEREAKSISQLNHPNICTLYDIGHESGTSYLVMELLEGESLADRLVRGPLPHADLLRYGAQIAAALDRAHRAGITHRDLKPGNVVITKSGAKLLDFGLAKSSAAPLAVSIDGATEHKPLTQEGTILGTFQYMAPEQVGGEEADSRTDIFAFGALLYEMATGRRAFEGSTRTSLIAAIVSAHPAPISSIAPMAPPALDHIVKKCLEKDPDDRWQSAHDVASELRWLSEAGSQAGVATTVTLRRKTREKLAWGLAVLFALIAIGVSGWMVARMRTTDAARPFHASVAWPAGLVSVPVAAGPIALSPDGTMLATLVARKSDTFISIYDFSTGKSAVLESTKDGSFPFWSPDSRAIGFFAAGKLRRVDAAGGAVQVLAEAHQGRGGSWSREGVIVFAPDIQGPLMRVSENGGTTTTVTKPGNEAFTHRNPLFLPDGKRFLFIERQSRTEAFGRLMAGSLDGATPRQVLEHASNAQFFSGRLLFVRDGNLLAQHFDLDTLSVSGAISPIAENLSYYNPRDLGDFSVSQTGLLAFRHEVAAENTLAWFDRDGRLIETLTDSGSFGIASVSRDLRQVALVREEAASASFDLWIVDATTRQTRRATFSKFPSPTNCAFSPDGQRLAVSSLSGTAGGGPKGGGWASSSLWLQPVSGVRTDKVLLESTRFYVRDWSPDGMVLLGDTQRTGTGHDLTYVRLDDAKAEVRDFVKTQYDERSPRFSPDGRWVLYSSNESGRPEVYLVDFPDAGRKFQISRDGGFAPIWSSDGSEIFFAQPPDAVMSVPVKLGDTIEIGAPVKLALSAAKTSAPFASDGKRFLVLQDSSKETAPPVEVIRNWAAGLPE